MLPPSFDGFLDFVRNSMRVPVEAIADDSPQLPLFYQTALEWSCYPGYDLLWVFAPATRVLLVYNLAASFMINMASDADDSTWFSDFRDGLGIGKPVTGFTSSAADQGTSGTQHIISALQNLSMAQLALFQDPWGRQALAIMGEMSPVWGYTP